MKPVIKLRERLYVPEQYVTSSIEREFTKIIPNVAVCGNCAYKNSPTCRDCDDGKIEIVLFNKKKEDKFYKFCRGNLGKIYRLFEGFDIVNETTNIDTSKYKLKFTKTLREDQDYALKEWMEYGYGIVQCPPRWGKTVWGIALVCELKQSTLILAHQDDLLNQFIFELEDKTNIKQLQEKYDEPLYGKLCDNHFKPYPLVSLSTYQSFIYDKQKTTKKKRLPKIKNSFGLILVDECHMASADNYHRILNKFNSEYRCGLSATPKRKDQLHVIANHTLGPVVVENKTKGMHCKVKVVLLNFKIMCTKWTYLINELSNNINRNEIIIKNVLKDYDNNRSILIVVERVKHASYLKKMLIENGVGMEKMKIIVGGTINRKGSWEKVKSGKVRITICTSKIVRLGINIPRWSVIHMTMPSNNKYNLLQLYSRVRTPFEGKPTPIIYDYLDEHSITFACFKTRKKKYEEEKFDIAYTNKKSMKEEKAEWGKINVKSNNRYKKFW